MARIWFSGYHTGNSVAEKTARTIGELIAAEHIDMSGATIMLATGGGGERKVTDLDTVLTDGDVVSIQKSSVKSGGFCTSREVTTPPPAPKEDIPRLMKDQGTGEIVLVNRDLWTAGNTSLVFSGTVVLSRGHELGLNSTFRKSAFAPFYGKVEIEYKR